jgi:hypothetical protein
VHDWVHAGLAGGQVREVHRAVVACHTKQGKWATMNIDR